MRVGGVSGVKRGAGAGRAGRGWAQQRRAATRTQPWLPGTCPPCSAAAPAVVPRGEKTEGVRAGGLSSAAAPLGRPHARACRCSDATLASSAASAAAASAGAIAHVPAAESEAAQVCAGAVGAAKVRFSSASEHSSALCRCQEPRAAPWRRSIDRGTRGVCWEGLQGDGAGLTSPRRRARMWRGRESVCGVCACVVQCTLPAPAAAADGAGGGGEGGQGGAHRVARAARAVARVRCPPHKAFGPPPSSSCHSHPPTHHTQQRQHSSSLCGPRHAAAACRGPPPPPAPRAHPPACPCPCCCCCCCTTPPPPPPLARARVLARRAHAAGPPTLTARMPPARAPDRAGALSSCCACFSYRSRRGATRRPPPYHTAPPCDSACKPSASTDGSLPLSSPAPRPPRAL